MTLLFSRKKAKRPKKDMADVPKTTLRFFVVPSTYMLRSHLDGK